jgi:MoxR-like ATPase
MGRDLPQPCARARAQGRVAAGLPVKPRHGTGRRAAASGNPDVKPPDAPRRDDTSLGPELAAESMAALRANVERALRGKAEVVRRAVETLVAGGHLLLEDLPGVGKTTLAQALARSIDGAYRRIQFTSDLLPSDVVGAAVPELADGRPTGRLVFEPGPVFANLVLADEINRASPKTQSALLEAMSEGAVSVDGVTRALPRPFTVIATQNPLEHAGTHPLPDSQLDRFLLRIAIGYPAPADEAAVLRDDPAASELPRLAPVLAAADLAALQQAAERIKFEASLVEYVLAIVAQTREHEALAVGVSPRGAVALRRAAQARALGDGRAFCIPEDVRELAVDVFAHRVVPARRASAASEEAQWIVREIVERVPVPL